MSLERVNCIFKTLEGVVTVACSHHVQDPIKGSSACVLLYCIYSII